RDDQQVRALVMPLTIEMLQLPKRLAEEDLLMDGQVLAADVDVLDHEFRLAARGGGVGVDLEACGRDWAHRAIAPRVRGVVQPSGAKARQFARTCEKRALNFIGVVKHPTSYLPS